MIDVVGRFFAATPAWGLVLIAIGLALMRNTAVIVARLTEIIVLVEGRKKRPDDFVP